MAAFRRSSSTRGERDSDREKDERRPFFRKRICRFCVEKLEGLDYKDVARLQKFDGKEFQAIDAEDLDLGKTPKLEGVEQDREQTVELLSFLKKTLADRVGDVRESQRLIDSPCALVTPRGGLSHNMERLMKLADREFTPTRRVLEINPRHPVIRNLGRLLEKQRGGAQLEDWAHLLVDYVLLGEGTVEDPQRVMRGLQSLMAAASEHLAKEG